MRDALRSALRKSRRSPCSSIASRKSPAAISRAGSFATSRFFSSTISSRMFTNYLTAENTKSTERKNSLCSLRSLRLFLFILPALHSFQRTTGAHPAVHERIEVAVHHGLHIAGFYASPQIFHHAIRLKNVTANLVSPRHA